MVIWAAIRKKPIKSTNETEANLCSPPTTGNSSTTHNQKPMVKSNRNSILKWTIKLTKNMHTYKKTNKITREKEDNRTAEKKSHEKNTNSVESILTILFNFFLLALTVVATSTFRVLLPWVKG